MSDTDTRQFMHNQPIADLNDELRGLILSVRDLNQRIETESLTGVQTKALFAEMYPPASLFSPAIRTLPATYSKIRDWLNEKGAALRPHSSHRIIMTLANELYTESEDTTSAVDIARGLMAQGRTSTSTSNTQSQNRQTTEASDNQHGSHKITHNMAMRFSRFDNKFTGDIGQSWNEFVVEYLQVARDYELSNAQKLQ